MDVTQLPFNQLLGLRLTNFQGREVISLKAEDQHANHVGTVHAGALYSLGEAASGHALAQALGGKAEQVVAVLRSAEVKYRRPADGMLYGLATVDEAAIEALNDRLAVKHRAFITVEVEVVSESGNEQLFAAHCTWYVTEREAP